MSLEIQAQLSMLFLPTPSQLAICSSVGQTDPEPVAKDLTRAVCSSPTITFSYCDFDIRQKHSLYSCPDPHPGLA